MKKLTKKKHNNKWVMSERTSERLTGRQSIKDLKGTRDYYLFCGGTYWVHIRMDGWLTYQPTDTATTNAIPFKFFFFLFCSFTLLYLLLLWFDFHQVFFVCLFVVQQHVEIMANFPTKTKGIVFPLAMLLWLLLFLFLLLPVCFSLQCKNNNRLQDKRFSHFSKRGYIKWKTRKTIKREKKKL